MGPIKKWRGGHRCRRKGGSCTNHMLVIGGIWAEQVGVSVYHHLIKERHGAHRCRCKGGHCRNYMDQRVHLSAVVLIQEPSDPSSSNGTRKGVADTGVGAKVAAVETICQCFGEPGQKTCVCIPLPCRTTTSSETWWTQVSARRWQRLGLLRTFAVNQCILTAWRCGVAPDTLAEWYYPSKRQSETDSKAQAGGTVTKR